MRTGSWVLQASRTGKSYDGDMEMGTLGISHVEVL